MMQTCLGSKQPSNSMARGCTVHLPGLYSTLCSVLQYVMRSSLPGTIQFRPDVSLAVALSAWCTSTNCTHAELSSADHAHPHDT